MNQLYRNSAENVAVIVTGCDSGFGRQISLQLAEKGATVFSGCYTRVCDSRPYLLFSRDSAVVMQRGAGSTHATPPPPPVLRPTHFSMLPKLGSFKGGLPGTWASWLRQPLALSAGRDLRRVGSPVRQASGAIAAGGQEPLPAQQRRGDARRSGRLLAGGVSPPCSHLLAVRLCILICAISRCFDLRVPFPRLPRCCWPSWKVGGRRSYSLPGGQRDWRMPDGRGLHPDDPVDTRCVRRGNPSAADRRCTAHPLAAPDLCTWIF